MLGRLADLEGEPSGSANEASLRILNGYLVWLEQAPADAPLRSKIAQDVAAFADRIGAGSGLERLEIDGDAPPAAEVAVFRRRLLQAADTVGESSVEPSAARAARADVVSLLRKQIDRELHELLQERDAELRSLELDLEVALSETLAPGTPVERSP
jgi:hypothetical protein